MAGSGNFRTGLEPDVLLSFWGIEKLLRFVPVSSVIPSRSSLGAQINFVLRCVIAITVMLNQQHVRTEGPPRVQTQVKFGPLGLLGATGGSIRK